MKQNLLKKFYACLPKGLAFIITAMLFSANANAQIVYTDVNPDVTQTCSVSIANGTSSAMDSIDINNDGIFDLRLELSVNKIGGGKTNTEFVKVSPLNGGAIRTDTSGFPLRMNLNDVIDTSGSASMASGQVLKYRYSHYNGTTTIIQISGNWITATDGFFGLKIVSGSQSYYCWVRLIVDANPYYASFTIKDYAYNSIANQLILAGDTGTGSSGIQAPNWVWAKSAGSTGNENGTSTTTDASGNVYVTGSFTSPVITFGATTLTNAGGQDIFLVKYDAAGNVIWAKGAGGAGNDFSTGTSCDASGNVYVTGGYASATITLGASTLTNAGGTDIITIKYDSSGNVLWAKGEGSTGGEYSQSIATDASGNACITGGFTSATLNIGGNTLNGNTGGFGGNNVFTVKYDASGNVLWAKGAGGGVFDNKGQGIATDASGNVYVIGYFDYPNITFGSITVNNSGGLGQLFDMFLVKYDSSGNTVWAKGAGAASSDQRGVAITTDATGNLFVTGNYKSSMKFGTITISNTGGIDMFIAKYDSSGNALWAKGAGGLSDDYGRSIATDTSGNVYVTGYYNSPSITFETTFLANAGGQDLFLVKYDAAGNMLWAKSEGGTSDDYSNSTFTDASGNVYVAGNFNSSSITFGATTLTNAGGSDMFIAKLGTTATTTSIANNTLHNEINVYPNPATNHLTIALKSINKKVEVTIVDITGKTIYKTAAFAVLNIEVNTADFAAGIYVVQIQSADFTATKKLIIQR